MIGWSYGNRSYKNHAGDAEWLMREALRRAIDIRDRGDEPVGARPVMLVDVLNALEGTLGFEDVDTIALWSEAE
jgi:hypothetical protein